MRIFYGGSLAKGMLLRSSRLPERTVVLHSSMRKVQGDSGSAAGGGIGWAFEVIQTATRERLAFANKFLCVLLDSLGGSEVGRDPNRALLQLQLRIWTGVDVATKQDAYGAICRSLCVIAQ